MKFPGNRNIYWECIAGVYLTVKDMAIVEAAITNSTLRQQVGFLPLPENLSEYTYEKIQEYRAVSPYRKYVRICSDGIVELSSTQMELWCNQRALQLGHVSLTANYMPSEVDVGWDCLYYVKHLELNMSRNQFDFSMISYQLKSLVSFTWKKYPNSDVESLMQELILCNDDNIHQSIDLSEQVCLQSLSISFERWLNDDDNTSKATAIASLTSLTSLDLNCGIGPRYRSNLSTVFEAVVSLPLLKSLLLQMIAFENKDWIILQQLRNLEEFSLSSSLYVDCLAIAELIKPSSTSLRKLDLRQNQYLPQPSFHTICTNLRNIRILHIAIGNATPNYSANRHHIHSSSLDLFNLIINQMHQLQDLALFIPAFAINDDMIQRLVANCQQIMRLDLRFSSDWATSLITRKGLESIASGYIDKLRFLGISSYLYDVCQMDFPKIFAQHMVKLEIKSSTWRDVWINSQLSLE
jgi:hypothetical protein